MVGTSGACRPLRHGKQSAAAAVFEFERDVWGGAVHPVGDGFYRQAHDGQPEPVGAADVVAAAGRGVGIFDRGGRAQYGPRTLGVWICAGSANRSKFQFVARAKKAVSVTLSHRDRFIFGRFLEPESRSLASLRITIAPR